jgi:hypothetical protein
MHLGARVVSPHNAVEIQEVMRGIRRLSTRGVVKKEAAVDAQIKRTVDTCDTGTYQGQRDRALLLMGFAINCTIVQRLDWRPNPRKKDLPILAPESAGTYDYAILHADHSTPRSAAALTQWARATCGANRSECWDWEYFLPWASRSPSTISTRIGEDSFIVAFGWLSITAIPTIVRREARGEPAGTEPATIW